MDTAKKITRHIKLKANTSTVWDVLTNPNKTKQYMFNCEVSSAWSVGSDITWKGNYMGYESGERGKILSVVPLKELRYSSIDPNFGIEDIPVNYLNVSYNINAIHNNETELIITVENFNQDENRLTHVSEGWDNIVIPALINTIER